MTVEDPVEETPVEENGRPGQASGYLDYLPAIYQQGVQEGVPNFLGRFLLAFEQVLTGLGDPDEPGIEERLDGIVDPTSGSVRLAGSERYFEPGPDLDPEQRAPVEFLDWLAGWVALTLRADLDEFRQRDFIARAVSLYHERGTRQGLEHLIQVYTRLAPTIDELNSPFQIGVRSTIGADTILGGGGPHYFRVLLRLSPGDQSQGTMAEQLRRQIEIVRAIIDLAKPAHTFYDLDVQTPSFTIGAHSTIGVDTLLATESSTSPPTQGGNHG